MRAQWTMAAAVLAAGVVAVAGLLRAGDLDPPTGPVGPTMATLGEIAAAVSTPGYPPAGVEAISTTDPQLPISLRLEGASQGQIRGEDEVFNEQDVIEVLGFSHGVFAPINPATGQATGHRQHAPITIRKRIDRTTPQLMHTLVTSENLTEVTLRFYRHGGAGREEQYYTVKLTNAQITAVNQLTVSNTPGQLRHMEEVSFAYESIVWTFEDGGITAEDDWETPTG